MNSEDTFRFKQIVTPQQLYAESERDKQNKSDAKTTAEGETIVAFISHPGWILMRQDMEVTINGLLEKLIACHGTLREREGLQLEIKMLKEFIKRPDVYVERLKKLHARKIKK